MTESTELLLFNANTTKEKKELSTFDRKNNTAPLIGINLCSFIFIFVHSISLMLLLNMPIVPENKAVCFICLLCVFVMCIFVLIFNNKVKIMTKIFTFGLNIPHTFLYFVTLKGFHFIIGKLFWLH